MANPEHLARIKEGAIAWKRWREENPENDPNLSGALLTGIQLMGFDLQRANLRDADLSGAQIHDVNLDGAYLTGAKLRAAILTSSEELDGASLNATNLTGADLRESKLIRADLRNAILTEADLDRADLTRADLRRANLTKASLSWTNCRGTDLQDSNLSHAKLIGSDLSGARLQRTILNNARAVSARFERADLKGAYMISADFTNAILQEANLSGAELSRANFQKVDLRGTALDSANFNSAQLMGADFGGSAMGGTVLGNVNLSQARGLELCQHFGPSILDFATLSQSGTLPLSFLRGCGLSDQLITYLPSLLNEAIQFYSLFISYSSSDQDFADRLYADLQSRGIRCWFAPHNIKGGRKIHEQIDEAIRLHDKLLLILSPSSMRSEWVKTEISKARRRELRDKARVLFPVRLVPFEVLCDWECFDADTGKDSAREIREYFIPDFSNWKNHDSYRSAFDRLVRDLQPPDQAER